MNKKKSTGILLSILGVISLVLITAGVTYAFFTYAKEGETENTITTGTITFLYDEKAGLGKGVQITEALPMDDNAGMALANESQVFDFSITASVSKGAKIPYLITARKIIKEGQEKNQIADDKIKIFLEVVDNNTSITSGSNTNKTKESGDKNYTILDGTSDIALFNDLTSLTTNSTNTTFKANQDDKVEVTVPSGIVEKKLYDGVVPAGSNEGTPTDYTANFRLRMWISGEEKDGVAAADYSPYEFVLTTEVTQNGATGEPLDADSLINSGKLITSSAYYALTEEQKATYERIAYVNQNSREIVGVSQKDAFETKLHTDFEEESDFWKESEQFYSLNGQTFTVTINVYANAAVVEQGA